jgi:hypothetical protein
MLTSATPSGAWQVIKSLLQDAMTHGASSTVTLRPVDTNQLANGVEALGSIPAPKFEPVMVIKPPRVGIRFCSHHPRRYHSSTIRYNKPVPRAKVRAGMVQVLWRTGVTVRLEGGRYEN